MAIISDNDIRTNVVNRFIRYAQTDSGSIDREQCPSTPEQRIFAEMLLSEALALGYEASLIPSGLKIHVDGNIEGIPTILLGAHLDTAGETPNKGVKVISHQVGSEDIVLPSGEVLRHKDNPELADYMGKKIFTSDGTTLLGADDKAGVAAIMTSLDFIKRTNSSHGAIDVVFTYDEEGTMAGAENLKPGIDTDAKYGFLFDGLPGTICVETFNAASAFLTLPKFHLEDATRGDEYKITLKGKYAFPGYAKKKGAVDAFRNISKVISVLTAADANITSIDGNFGGLELVVNFPILKKGLADEALACLRWLEDSRLKDQSVAVEISDPEEKKIPSYALDLSQIQKLMEAIPYGMSAERTEGKEGYIQPMFFMEKEGELKLFTIIRDFTLHGLEEKKSMLAGIPGIKIRDDYKNVRTILEQTPEIIDVSQTAMEKAGISGVILDSTRGGNEASTYTLKGLSCVDLGALGNNWHTKLEYISEDQLVTNVKVIQNLVELVARGNLYMSD